MPLEIPNLQDMRDPGSFNLMGTSSLKDNPKSLIQKLSEQIYERVTRYPRVVDKNVRDFTDRLKDAEAKLREWVQIQQGLSSAPSVDEVVAGEVQTLADMGCLVHRGGTLVKSIDTVQAGIRFVGNINITVRGDSAVATWIGGPVLLNGQIYISRSSALPISSHFYCDSPIGISGEICLGSGTNSFFSLIGGGRFVEAVMLVQNIIESYPKPADLANVYADVEYYQRCRFCLNCQIVFLTNVYSLSREEVIHQECGSTFTTAAFVQGPPEFEDLTDKLIAEAPDTDPYYIRQKLEAPEQMKSEIDQLSIFILWKLIAHYGWRPEGYSKDDLIAFFVRNQQIFLQGACPCSDCRGFGNDFKDLLAWCQLSKDDLSGLYTSIQRFMLAQPKVSKLESALLAAINGPEVRGKLHATIKSSTTKYKTGLKDLLTWFEAGQPVVERVVEPPLKAAFGCPSKVHLSGLNITVVEVFSGLRYVINCLRCHNEDPVNYMKTAGRCAGPCGHYIFLNQQSSFYNPLSELYTCSQECLDLTYQELDEQADPEEDDDRERDR